MGRLKVRGKEGSSRSNAAEKGKKTEPITQVKGLGNYQEANVFCKRKNQLDVTISRLLGRRVGAGAGLSRFGCDYVGLRLADMLPRVGTWSHEGDSTTSQPDGRGPALSGQHSRAEKEQRHM